MNIEFGCPTDFNANLQTEYTALPNDNASGFVRPSSPIYGAPFW